MVTRTCCAPMKKKCFFFQRNLFNDLIICLEWIKQQRFPLTYALISELPPNISTMDQDPTKTSGSGSPSRALAITTFTLSDHNDC